MSFCIYNGCELFMKGIGYSYYYEQEDDIMVMDEVKEDKP
jgi:hypothetical protein